MDNYKDKKQERENLKAYDKRVLTKFKRLTRTEFEINQSKLDYAKDDLTFQMKTWFYENMKEERDLEYLTPKPSFLDWLLGRRKVVKFDLKVKDLLLDLPNSDEARIYVVEFKD